MRTAPGTEKYLNADAHNMRLYFYYNIIAYIFEKIYILKKDL